MATSLSSVQRKRQKTGKQKENLVGQVIKKLGYELQKPPRVPISECPTTTMDVDNYLPCEKIFIEVKGSVKDGVLFKIILQAKNIKRHHPNNQFVVLIAGQPKRDKSFVKHLKSCPYIDEVIVIWKEDFEKLKDLRKILMDILDVYLSNNFQNRLNVESELVKECIRGGIESHEDNFHIPIIDKKMSRYFRENEIDTKSFITTGSLDVSVGQMSLELE
jgi:hypothetical protein